MSGQARATEVTVVVPWSGDAPDRLRALAFVRAWYREHFPRWHLELGAATDGWCKADSAMPAVHSVLSGVVVLSDADVICDGVGLAVDAVLNGRAWAIPHRMVKRLSPAATEHLIHRGEMVADYARPPYEGITGGGVVVARREVLLDVPLDSRFRGWGQDDEAHGDALRCLYGEPWRGKADLIHLWHPPQERMTDAIGSEEGRALRRRYRRARRDPEAMRALLQEA